MSYFSEFPNIKYLSPFSNRDSNTTTILAKNIFKRAKLREDIAKTITVFTYYTIQGDERPEQVAEKIYKDPELDWVILITNNITNIQNQWPLDNQSFHNYLLEKYGSEEAIYLPHHYETIETRDEYNRLVIPEGLNVDPRLDINVTTKSNQKEYNLPHFPSKDLNPKVSVNLIQKFKYYKKDGTLIERDITSIKDEISQFKLYNKSGSEVNISINNSLETWPSSWNGQLQIQKRNGTVSSINIDDKLSQTSSVEISNKLYRIVSVSNIPSFSFYPLNYAPSPNMNINIKTDGFKVKYLDTKNTIVELDGRMNTITNYEYEERLQNEKRNILVLNPQYLSTFISDFKKIMRYSESSQYVDQKTKSVYNPNLSGV